MLSVEDNETLTRVGKGTPMGELLRRYWYPIAASNDLDMAEASGIHRGGTKAVRLLGEDLALFRDLKGRLGLVERLCAHRRVSLVFGIPEEEGIRCPYHGWMYDSTGQCIEQPFEEISHPEGKFKDSIKLPAYKVEELGGLIWAYLGPEPAPLLPRWDLLVMDNVIRDIEYVDIPCNWVQIMENSVDTVHVQWLHSYLTAWSTGKAERAVRNHARIAFDDFEHGIMKRRLYDDEAEDSVEWTRGHPILIPNILRIGNQLQIRVPVDDTNTMHVLYTAHMAPEGVTAPGQSRFTMREVPMFDDMGNRLLDFNQGQDTMAWVTQGDIAKREKEKLGESDRGLVMYRRMLLDQAAIVADGGDPMNVLRDPETNQFLELPTERVLGTYRSPRAGVGDGRRGSVEVQELLRQMYASTPSS
jgi:5,5'-dehydrodivanillate O-demethylase